MDTDSFVESMSLTLVIAWANLLGIEHDKESWLDDEYPEKEDDLRVSLAEKMAQVGSPHE